jgi:hypothetical protein
MSEVGDKSPVSPWHKTIAFSAKQKSYMNLLYNFHNATEDFLVDFLDIGTAVEFPSTDLVGFCRHHSDYRRCLVGSVP